MQKIEKSDKALYIICCLYIFCKRITCTQVLFEMNNSITKNTENLDTNTLSWFIFDSKRFTAA